MKIFELKNKIEALNFRSAWDKGVKGYAIELLENVTGGNFKGIDETTDFDNVTTCKLLNHVGAGDMKLCDVCKSVSEGGNFEIYDGEIAKRLCTPSELKRTMNGEKDPNRAKRG